jgi:hypothetical protein
MDTVSAECWRHDCGTCPAPHTCACLCHLSNAWPDR